MNFLVSAERNLFLNLQHFHLHHQPKNVSLSSNLPLIQSVFKRLIHSRSQLFFAKYIRVVRVLIQHLFDQIKHVDRRLWRRANFYYLALKLIDYLLLRIFISRTRNLNL